MELLKSLKSVIDRGADAQAIHGRCRETQHSNSH